MVPTNEVLEPWADQIERWLKHDRLKLTRVQELLAQCRHMVAYTSLRRFVIRRGWLGKSSQTTVRMADTKLGEVVEADFGRLGLMGDPRVGEGALPVECWW